MSAAVDGDDALAEAAREWLAAEEARDRAMEAYQAAAERVKVATAALRAAVRAGSQDE